MMKTVDKLPRGAQWLVDIIDLKASPSQPDSPIVEKLELWRREGIELVKELIGNPKFKDVMFYAPEKHYTDESRTQREYSEAHTGNFWWRKQVSLTVS
jgi:hypothetical protein